MNNTNPQAIAFAENEIRPIADRLAQLYFEAKKVTTQFQARNLGATIMPADDNPIVRDEAAATDGRPPVTGNLALGIIFRLNELIADYEANGGTKLYSVLQVSPTP